jgi:hypothetical protein
MNGKVGFRLERNDPILKKLLNDTELEVIEPTLSLDYLPNDDFVCFNLMMLLKSFGFEPSGPNMERYQLNDLLNFQWMIPVLHGDSVT